MSTTKGSGTVASYEDRGFLGDYARDIPTGVTEPLARAIYAIGRQAYLSQTVRDALSFQDTLVKQAEEIFQTNRNDPAGYVRAMDDMVTEITRGRNGKDRRSQAAEMTKREHMISIAQNVEEENYHASRQIIRDLMGQSLNGMGVGIHLLSSDDGTIRSVGRECLKRLISRTVNDMATVDGHGNRLIGPEEEATFLQRFNGNIVSGVLGDRLSKCRSGDEVDDLVAMVESGKFAVPQFRIAPGVAGNGVEMDDQALKISSSNGMGKNFMAMADNRKFAIVRDGTTSRQVAVLRDSNDHTMLRGTTQPSADAWFQDYGDAIGSAIAAGNGEDAKRTIEYLARKTDRVPSQVVAIIRGAVTSGDNAAIQVACPYAMAWHGENPAALSRAFRDDGMTLLRMFVLANQMSTADTTSVGVRDRTLKTFSQPQTGEGRTATYERLAMDYGSDDMLTTMVSAWKNNGAGRKGPEETWEQEYLSPFFLATMREKFRDYLEDSGGDIAAATRMMEGTISQMGISKLGTVPSPLMPYCPEEYPGVVENKESITHALETIGEKQYGDLVADGRIPDGAEYVGTFLLSDAISESLAEDLDSNWKRGIDHISGQGEEQKISCPSYAQMITFSFGGLVHTMPVSRFQPSHPSHAHDPITGELETEVSL